jgi:ribosomal subunit interface protein
MQVSVKGKQIDVGDSLRRHVEAAIAVIVEKYVGSAIEGHAAFSREAHLFHCELSVHFGRGLMVQAQGEAADAYAAFDLAVERTGKRLRRYKRRLRDHQHGRDRESPEPLRARTYLLAREPDDDEPAAPDRAGAPDAAPAGDGATAEDGAPVIIAEMTTEIPTLSVGEAAMRMDLADLPSFVFRNRSHGGLNVVYRRNDGHIGWVDPDLSSPGR